MLARHDQRQVMLGDLLPGLSTLDWAARRSIAGMTLDSRDVEPRGLWIALQGVRGHALDHFAEARERGVTAVLAEPAGHWDRERIGRLCAEVPVLAIPGLRRQAGEIAARFFGQAAQAMRVIGVTGTNGKTSVTHFLTQALSTRVPTALIGTVGNGFPGDLQSATHTTPDPVSLHALLADFYIRGARALAMEVSSHALHQDRVSGVPFHTAVFTNLSRDHQDYHGSMRDYADAKAKLFRGRGLSLAVINVDDQVGAQIAAEVRTRVYTVAVGSATAQLRLGDRYLLLRDVEARADGLRLGFDSSWGSGELHSRLMGRFNAENLALALAVLLAWDMPLGSALSALQQCHPVDGRMMLFLAPMRPRVIVDYAHTPAALEQVLSSLRGHVNGQLICVFGCGGDRDQGKRPLMGEIAERLADRVVLTDDNPRGESPQRIVEAIVSGMMRPVLARIEHDRARAIEAAIGMAGVNDLVVVAGKGHEEYQEGGDGRRPFSDIEQVRLALRGGSL